MKDLRIIHLIIKCLLLLHVEVLSTRDAKVIKPESLVEFTSSGGGGGGEGRVKGQKSK